jgi:thiaminase/transcriptional activator TenA
VSAAQSFTVTAWSAVTDIRQAIDDHPFLRELREGTLSEERFSGYLSQDAVYLVGYARALSLCAAKASTADEIGFWALNAHDAIVVERSLHDFRVAGRPAIPTSPTCSAYVAFLLATAAQQSYPVLAAALLPCFWIYEDVGRRLKDSVELVGHPYADWISAYGDADFAVTTERAKDIVDGLADRASPGTTELMHAAFATAARYEWLFWDAAWRRETWPAFGAANGSATTNATTKEAMDADSHG